MTRELLFSITKKDLDVDYFSGTGAGGQYRNKHQNCVRIRHKESGAFATGQSNRDRIGNMKEALNGLVSSPKFKSWIARRKMEIDEGMKIEEKIETMISPENIKIEYKDDNGRWTEKEICENGKF